MVKYKEVSQPLQSRKGPSGGSKLLRRDEGKKGQCSPFQEDLFHGSLLKFEASRPHGNTKKEKHNFILTSRMYFMI